MGRYELLVLLRYREILPKLLPMIVVKQDPVHFFSSCASGKQRLSPVADYGTLRPRWTCWMQRRFRLRKSFWEPMAGAPR